jgi:hypothetical protein
MTQFISVSTIRVIFIMTFSSHDQLLQGTLFLNATLGHLFLLNATLHAAPHATL